MKLTKRGLPRKMFFAEIGEDQHKQLLSLFGSMIGEPNAVKKMGQHIIDWNILPREKDGSESMYSRFLRIFYVLSGDRDPALADEKDSVIVTQGDMVRSLALEVGEEKATEFVDKAVNRKPIDASVFGSAAMLSDWIENRKGAAAFRAAAAVFDGRIGLAAEQWHDAMELVKDAAPRPKKIDAVEGVNIFDRWKKVYNERLRLAAEGRTAGPKLPWGLSRKVAMLKKSDLNTFAGKSSTGKSTIALLLAHEIAHKQKGYDVAYFYMETRTESQADRLISNGIWKFSADSKNGQGVLVQDLQDPSNGFNLWEDKVASKAYDDAEADYRRRSEENGRVWFVHCPGITSVEMTTQVAMYKALAQAKDRELVVIVDYYSLLSPIGLISPDAAGWAQNDAKADFFKELAEQQEVFMITFAQDNMEADYTDNNRKTTKNGSLIYERSQVLIRIMRPYADANKPWNDDKGKQRVDLAGRPIFWHVAGQPQSDAQLVVEKASDGATGPIDIRVFNSYWQIFEQTIREAK